MDSMYIGIAALAVAWAYVSIKRRLLKWARDEWIRKTLQPGAGLED